MAFTHYSVVSVRQSPSGPYVTSLLVAHMSPLFALPSVFILAFVCYLTGFVLGCFVGNLRKPPFNWSGSSEKQLRIEVRDLISRIILDTLERDEIPTLRSITGQCPVNMSNGRAWEIWTAESYKMLKIVLTEDL